MVHCSLIMIKLAFRAQYKIVTLSGPTLLIYFVALVLALKMSARIYPWHYHQTKPD